MAKDTAQFYESNGNYIAKRGIISVKIVYIDDEWVLIFTAFGFIELRVSVNDILELLRKKK